MSELRVNATATAGGTDAYRYVDTVYFTSNGTFTKADYPWLRAIRVKCQGAGGAGGGGRDASASNSIVSPATGGGGGHYAESFITDISALGSSETITVGTGGAGVSGTTGSNGGSSSFGSLVTAGGGEPGRSRGPDSPPLAILMDDNTPFGSGDLIIGGGQGESGNGMGFRFDEVSGGNGGGSVLGSGGKGGIGGNGIFVTTAGAGFGGGGGGAHANGGVGAQTGGDGADGIVIVELYA